MGKSPESGANGTTSAPVFSFIYRWTDMGRKGQHCRIIEASQSVHGCRIEFEDGHQADVSRNAIRLAKGVKSSTNSVTKGGRGESPEPLNGHGRLSTAHLAQAATAAARPMNSPVATSHRHINSGCIVLSDKLGRKPSTQHTPIVSMQPDSVTPRSTAAKEKARQSNT